MLLTEYNEAETMELFRKDGVAEGRAEGLAEGLAEGVVKTCQALGETREGTAARLADTLSISVDEASEQLARWWQ